MATSSVPNLASLLNQSSIDDHEQILKAANTKLKSSKNDPEAQHVKVTALLKLDRFDDALRALESGGDKLREHARLEWAYALYKSGEPGKAAEVARGGAERGLRHVEAQASYRIEDFQRAAEIYEQLARSLENDAEADLRINSSAVDAQLAWAGQGDFVQKKKPAREDLEAFETAYNAACGSIARGELKQAEVLLKRAKDLCTALEDLNEEEKQVEVLPITVQQLYVLTRQGKHEDAATLAASVNVQDLQDKGTKHIAQVNKLASTATPANPFLTQRLVSQSLDSLKPDTPFAYQTSILKQNQYAADLQSLKYEGVASSTQAAITKVKQPTLDPRTNSLSTFNAAAQGKNQMGRAAIKLVLPLLEKRPNDVGLVMTIIQLSVLTGNQASATSLLEEFFNKLELSGGVENLDIRFAPGLVGTLTSLFNAQGRRTSTQSELAKAAQHWRRKTESPPAAVTNLLKSAGSRLLDSTDPSHHQLAKDIFTDLHTQDPKDRYATAGLLAVSPSTASNNELSSLTPADRLTANIDAEALEAAGIATAPLTAPTTVKRKADDLQKPRKRKRLTANRRMENYDPNFKPDPERWLPLRDRSTYRPKGKKSKARQNLLSQGAVDVDSGGSRPGMLGGEVVKAKQAPGGGAGGGQSKRKKGKGKK